MNNILNNAKAFFARQFNTSNVYFAHLHFCLNSLCLTLTISHKNHNSVHKISLDAAFISMEIGIDSAYLFSLLNSFLLPQKGPWIIQIILPKQWVFVWSLGKTNYLQDHQQERLAILNIQQTFSILVADYYFYAMEQKNADSEKLFFAEKSKLIDELENSFKKIQLHSSIHFKI